jgi:ubiquinone/menaquinone biosynthesis C-methylase UbiE
VAERTLAAPELHRRWEGRYHTAENARFHDEVVERLVERVAPRPDALALDIGCGPGLQAVRLARHGLRVCAADFSPAALGQAERTVEAAGLADRVEVVQADLLDLPFPDGRFDLVLCWGVLMHIPDVERAIAELCRVVAPGGSAVVGEGNVRSIDHAIRWIGSQRRGSAPYSRTPAGAERWRETASGPLLARRADVRWLARALEAQGLSVRRPIAGQFTEGYVHLREGSVQQRALHAFNRLWFRYVRTGFLANGVHLIAQRPSTAAEASRM